MESSLLLPIQSLLIHIGPHKTGTTALQSAFHAARPHLEQHGVRYAGEDRQPLRAVSALIGKTARRGEPAPSMFNWDRLSGEINDATEPRVVLSCESFADGDDDVPVVVADTFKSRTMHVVVTLRPLSRILPSAWQQYVQNGLTTPYPRWLEQIFTQPDAPRAERFWQRHDHAALIERWLRIVEPDRLTVVVADEKDRDMLLRTFEGLVGLPSGLLVPELQNRSLTWGEVELHRRLNVAFKQHGWTEVEFAKLLRHGMASHLQQNYKPPAKVAKLPTPHWALERAAQAGAGYVAAIRRLGVNVVGDLDSLAAPPPPELAGDAEQPPASLPMKAVTQAVVGVIIGSRTEAPIEIVEARAQRRNGLLPRVLRRLKRLVMPPTDSSDAAPFEESELD